MKLQLESTVGKFSSALTTTRNVQPGDDFYDYTPSSKKRYEDVKLYCYISLCALTLLLISITTYSWFHLEDNGFENHTTTPTDGNPGPNATTISVTFIQNSTTAVTAFTMPQSSTAKVPVTKDHITMPTTAIESSSTSREDEATEATKSKSSTIVANDTRSTFMEPETTTILSTTGGITFEEGAGGPSTFSAEQDTSAISTKATTPENKEYSTTSKEGTTQGARTTPQSTTIEAIFGPDEILANVIEETDFKRIWYELDCKVDGSNKYNLTMGVTYKNYTLWTTSVLSPQRAAGYHDILEMASFSILSQYLPQVLELYKDPFTGKWPSLWEEGYWTIPITNFTCRNQNGDINS